MKKFLQKLFILLMFTGSMQTANGQAGYIVTLGGDTVQGTLRINQYSRRIEEVHFNRLGSGSETTYYPGQIAAFSIPSQQERYESKSVNIDISPNTMTQLYAEGNFDTSVTQTVFLNVLVMGTANLFYYEDSTKKPHFFIQTNDGPVQELNVYYRLQKAQDENSHDQFLVQDAYKTQLINDLGACPGIENMINSSDYTSSSLVKIFDYFNQCTGKPAYVNKSSLDRFFIHPGIIAGYANNNLAPNAKNSQAGPPTEQLVFGFSLEYRIKPLNNLFSIYADAYFKDYNSFFTADNYQGGFDMLFINLDYLLRVKFPIGKAVKVFLEGGGSSAFFDVAPLDVNNANGNAIPQTTQFQMVVGGGIIFINRIILEGRFSTGTVQGFNNEFNFNNQSINLQVGVQL